MERHTLPVALEGLAILATAGTGLWFLNKYLRSIVGTVGRITAGVRAIERQVMNAGPAVERLNQALDEASRGVRTVA